MGEVLAIDRGAAFLDERAARGTRELAIARLAQEAALLAGGPPADRFRTVTMLELLNAKLPEPEPILAPWLMVQSLAQIHAWRGTGKTFVSLGIAYAVASGGSFLGWQAPAPRRVLFLDGEMPAARLRERLNALVAADDRDVDVDERFLRFVTPDLLSGPPPDLGRFSDQEELDDVIGNVDPALVIVDNISTLVRSGGAENEAASWVAVQDWALRHRQRGRAVLFIHHSGKDGRQRGTSKREDILDAVISLKRPADTGPDDGARFIVEFEKSRYVHGDKIKPFEAWLKTGADGRQVWTLSDAEQSTFDRVVELHREGVEQRDMAEMLGVHKGQVSRHLSRAKTLGMIRGGA